MPTDHPSPIKTISATEGESRGERLLLFSALGEMNELLGTALVEFKTASTVYLRDLHVDVEGRGVGRAILDEVKATLREAGVQRIECDVSAYRGDFRNPKPPRAGQRERLRLFYRRAGFVEDPDAVFGSWVHVLA